MVSVREKPMVYSIFTPRSAFYNRNSAKNEQEEYHAERKAGTAKMLPDRVG